MSAALPFLIHPVTGSPGPDAGTGHVIDMKMPRSVKRYCSGKCQSHTDHDVERGKKRKASELSWGQRRFRRATAGYTGFPRPKPEGREKPTKRIYLRFTCKKCGRTQQPQARRAKKFELIEVKA